MYLSLEKKKKKIIFSSRNASNNCNISPLLKKFADHNQAIKIKSNYA